MGSSVGVHRRMTGSIPAPTSLLTRESLLPMLAPSLRNVTHLTPMLWAAATNLSTTSCDCSVVGIQCMPRPLSPSGCGYPLSASGADGLGAAGGRTGWGGRTGVTGLAARARAAAAAAEAEAASDAADAGVAFLGANGR